MTQRQIHGISSMATRQVLADLVAAFTQQSGTGAVIESVGGVDAAKRVAAGEPFDVVILASDAIDKLLAAGHLLPGSKVDWVHSGVAVAVPAGAPLPDIASEDAVRQAVLAAPASACLPGPAAWRWPGCSSAGALPGRSRHARCRLPRACLWARWWPGARWRWAFSS